MDRIARALKRKGVDVNSPSFDTSLQTPDLQPHNSPLFSASWFGRSGSVPESIERFHHRSAWQKSAILDGRWAFTTVPRLGDGSVW